MQINKQEGSSLVEVMVGLFVFAIGLLGILALQAKSIQFNQSAYAYSQAVYLANAMAEQIKANPSADGSFLYQVEESDQNITAGTDCSATACGENDLAAWDKEQWLAQISNALPAGQGLVEELEPVNTRRFAAVTVSFDDSRSEAAEQGNNNADPAPVRKEYRIIVGL